MANPYNYPEIYMHSQREVPSDAIHLDGSNASVHAFGCLMRCCEYIISRTLGRDVGPTEWLTWCNNNGGFTSNGDLKFDAVSRFTNGKLRKWPVSIGANFIILKVSFAGQTHFVVLLKNPKTNKLDIIFDPWQVSAHVQSRYIYPQIGTLYFKLF